MRSQTGIFHDLSSNLCHIALYNPHRSFLKPGLWEDSRTTQPLSVRFNCLFHPLIASLLVWRSKTPRTNITFLDLNKISDMVCKYVYNVKAHNIRLMSKRKYCGFVELSPKAKKLYSKNSWCFAMPHRAKRLGGWNGQWNPTDSPSMRNIAESLLTMNLTGKSERHGTRQTPIERRRKE
jgi:hypothetical protein